MRVGILGLGSIGMRHAKNALLLGHEVFGFDPVEGRQALLASYGGVATTRSGVLSCDKVVVASPTPSHWDDIRDVKIPCLLEKPIADRPLEDLDLSYIELVGYNLRYHACVRQAKNWVTAGFIGKPLCSHFVLAQFNEKPAYLRDGVILNWSHEIDLALHILGPGELLSIASKNNTIADLFIHHSNGCLSSVHLNYVNKKEVRKFDILGDKGTIRCVLSPYRHADCENEDGSIYQYQYHTTFDEDYVTEMKAFLSGDTGPGCTADEAAQVLKICLGGL